MSLFPIDRVMPQALRASKMRGVHLAIVVDNTEGEGNPGYRVKVKYPWMSEDIRSRNTEGGLMIDLAVYGARNTRRDRDLSQLLEEEVYRLDGLKTLIGRNHYDEERFWAIYDRDAYDKAKVELDPTGAFPNLYDKLGRV